MFLTGPDSIDGVIWGFEKMFVLFVYLFLRQGLTMYVSLAFTVCLYDARYNECGGQNLKVSVLSFTIEFQ